MSFQKYGMPRQNAIVSIGELMLGVGVGMLKILQAGGGVGILEILGVGS